MRLFAAVCVIIALSVPVWKRDHPDERWPRSLTVAGVLALVIIFALTAIPEGP